MSNKLCPSLHEWVLGATAKCLKHLASCHLHMGQHSARLVLQQKNYKPWTSLSFEVRYCNSLLPFFLPISFAVAVAVTVAIELLASRPFPPVIETINEKELVIAPSCRVSVSPYPHVTVSPYGRIGPHHLTLCTSCQNFWQESKQLPSPAITCGKIAGEVRQIIIRVLIGRRESRGIQSV